MPEKNKYKRAQHLPYPPLPQLMQIFFSHPVFFLTVENPEKQQTEIEQSFTSEKMKYGH